MNIKDYYQKLAGTGSRDEELRYDLVGSLIPASAKKILDLGCSDGRASSTFKKDDNIVIGADIQETLLKQAREVLDEVYTIDLDERWDVLQDGSFDCVVMSAVLEHIFDYRNVFSELARVIKPGGHFIHATPNAASLRGRVDLALGKVPSWFQNFEHIRLWTRSYLEERLRGYGFVEEQFLGCYVKTSTLLALHSRLFPSLAPIIIQKFRRL